MTTTENTGASARVRRRKAETSELSAKAKPPPKPSPKTPPKPSPKTSPKTSPKPKASGKPSVRRKASAKSQSSTKAAPRPKPKPSAALPRQRDPDATKARILEAAKREFSRVGLGGARVDSIAARAKANKRMIYHYFDSKEDLFTAVLEESYLGIRAAERRLALDALPPQKALDTLVRFTWRYYLQNPEFLTFVNSENLHKARHLRTSNALPQEYPRFIEIVQRIIDRGAADGVFRRGIDAVQLNITIAAISYYYLTNRYTGSIIYDRDLMAKDRLDERLEFNVETIRRLVRADPKA